MRKDNKYYFKVKIYIKVKGEKKVLNVIYVGMKFI